MDNDRVSIYQQPAIEPNVAQFIDEEVVAKLKPYLDATDSLNTSTAYASDWRQFEKWALLAGERDYLPTKSSVLLDYLTDKADLVKGDGSFKYAPSTIARHRISIDRVNRDLGFDRPGDHHDVRNFLKGLKRIREYRTVRKSPVLTVDMKNIFQTLKRWELPYAVRDRRDRLILLLGFAGAFRRSELCDIQLKSITVTKSEMLIYLSRSKTDKQAQGNYKGIPYGVHRSTCPICAYVEWVEMLKNPRIAASEIDSIDGKKELRDDDRAGHICSEAHLINTSEIEDTYLIRRVTKDATVGTGLKPFSTTSIATIIKELMLRIGANPDNFSGHSLRAGFVTQAFKNGADAHSIMRQTNHTNPAMLEIYSREYAPLENNAVTNVGL